jgi:hypothetical protein
VPLCNNKPPEFPVTVAVALDQNRPLVASSARRESVGEMVTTSKSSSTIVAKAEEPPPLWCHWA